MKEVETKMKTRSKQKFSLNTVEKIKALKDKGFNSTEASKIIGISSQATQFYYRVLNAVENGKEIPVEKKHYCEEAVVEYCAKHNLQYIPKLEHKQEEQQIISELNSETDFNSCGLSYSFKTMMDSYNNIADIIHKNQDVFSTVETSILDNLLKMLRYLILENYAHDKQHHAG